MLTPAELDITAAAYGMLLVNAMLTGKIEDTNDAQSSINNCTLLIFISKECFRHHVKFVFFTSIYNYLHFEIILKDNTKLLFMLLNTKAG